MFGIAIDRVTMAEAVELVLNSARAGDKPGYVVTPNLQHVSLCQKNTEFKISYKNAKYVFVDGVPLLWASRIFGQSLPERINGTDLTKQLCTTEKVIGLRVGFLGGEPKAAQCVAENLKIKNPLLNVSAIFCPEKGFEKNREAVQNLNKNLKEQKLDMLFVALGSPKQEIWMHHNNTIVNIPVMIGIGGSFELLSGMKKRAPLWMQKSGLEWLFRLILEPKRLFIRYADSFYIFLKMSAVEIRKKKQNGF